MQHAHILLYNDEFDKKTWEAICEIAGICNNAETIKLVIDKDKCEEIK